MHLLLYLFLSLALAPCLALLVDVDINIAKGIGSSNSGSRSGKHYSSKGGDVSAHGHDEVTQLHLAQGSTPSTMIGQPTYVVNSLVLFHKHVVSSD